MRPRVKHPEASSTYSVIYITWFFLINWKVIYNLAPMYFSLLFIFHTQYTSPSHLSVRVYAIMTPHRSHRLCSLTWMSKNAGNITYAWMGEELRSINNWVSPNSEVNTNIITGFKGAVKTSKLNRSTSREPFTFTDLQLNKLSTTRKS